MTVFRFPMFFTVVNRDEKVLFSFPNFAHFLRERDLTYFRHGFEEQLIRNVPLPRAAEGGPRSSGHTPIGCDLRATGSGSREGIIVIPDKHMMLWIVEAQE